MVGVSLHQPNFNPWAKLLAKIAASDVYIAYDSVQFTRTEFHNRQRLRSRQGTTLLSVPVRGGKSRQLLQDVQLDQSSDWRGHHLRVIEQEYRRAPHFQEFFPLLEEVYGRHQTMLVDFNLDVLATICGYLNFETAVVRASTLPHAGDNTDRLIALTLAVNGDTHLTSTWGTDRKYIDWQRVSAAGLTVKTQEFIHPRYLQRHEPFEPNLGVMDLIFAKGKLAADSVVRSSNFIDVRRGSGIRQLPCS